jgi:hypothetical protein
MVDIVGNTITAAHAGEDSEGAAPGMSDSEE